MFINNRYDALKRLHSLFSDKRWIFAKTMPDNPHEYTLRKEWRDDDNFAESVQLIRDHGYVVRFKGRKYIQFNVLGHFYWSMGAPIPATILINRACIDKDSKLPYDDISNFYDDWFLSSEYEQENADLMAILKPFLSEKVLDVGCGTGLLLDLLDISPDVYTGVDPSRMMLGKFRSKHPHHKAIQSRYEDFPFEGFDSIVSLYGAFNYCEPSSVAQVINQLSFGGKYFLVMFKDDYNPVTHELAHCSIPYYKFSDYVFPDESIFTEFTSYIIVTGVKE